MIQEEKLRAEIGGFTRRPSQRRFSRFAPLIIWATLIFIGSSDLLSASHTSTFLVRPLQWLFPHASDTTLEVIHFLLRKAGHLTEYAILALLSARAFLTSPGELWRRRWFWISLGLVVVYALSDEYHQSYVPSRTASIYDSMIDSVGGFFALSLVWLRQKRIQRKSSRVSVAA